MIKFYTTHCGMCKALKGMMDARGIEYELIDDIDIVMNVAENNNISSAPFAEIDDKVVDSSVLRKYIMEAK